MSDKCAYPKCGKELIHIQGRKKKKYCGADCRVRHYKILHPDKRVLKTKRIPIEQWEEIQAKLNEGLNKKSEGLILTTSIKNKQQFESAIKEVINNSKPERLPGESSLDYRIRCEELAAKK